ncbi:MAG: hypothetical protein M9905_15960, partial [Rhizobiaceae bacterium]|nr:hypothetical protein [Rhizobiaceae bacterium]
VARVETDTDLLGVGFGFQNSRCAGHAILLPFALVTAFAPNGRCVQRARRLHPRTAKAAGPERRRDHRCLAFCLPQLNSRPLHWFRQYGSVVDRPDGFERRDRP